VVGGVDSPSKAVERLFAGRRWLSTERCRPFGARRDGTSLGEGAALILLERQGEATVELLAVAEARPRGGPALEAAVHLTAMRNALQAGAVPPERVGCLHAQACGFARADAVEAQAFQAMFGSRVPLLASAGATGHLLGAAAATGVALAASCLEAGIVPVSVGLDGMRTTPARLEGDFAVVHAWGLDGSAVSIVLGVRDL
jgi:3-oxoacyl-(acyl-carrier-protein) synthase